ncbi:ABC transporter substrate-binding protein [Desulfoscipio gibsoniae]|uniref:ABC-type dipeptide transport system, periplasmic component n=1 Tax=Desulfoscipio gibsoniae DSM 7213 TaxID=767817 RepID=R4KB15_9FIRM|nr:ABC transporter substrate-binding protein [Desulfoscipio gibsoniae]AGL00373.1 ABC-type dipeptide transport system, periplasmic component [Desulfoscipio gibsoniae DSM 7213]
MQRKYLLLLLLGCLLCVFIAAGCGGEDDNDAAADRQDTSGQQQLIVAISTDVSNWDLDKFPEGDSRFPWSQIYETLVRLDTDLKEQPGLAVSWEPSEGGKVWTFHLRKGVKFSDGSPLNAEAVVYSYSSRADVVKRKMLPVQSIEPVDEYTVKFTCSQPTPLPSYFTHVAWPVMSLMSLDDGGAFKGPIGTGPYKLDKHLTDQEIVMVRNEHYWGEPGTLDKIIFKVIPDASARSMALQSGQVDMALKINEFDIENLESQAGINIYKKPSTFTDFLQFNTEKSPFDDVNVRRAVSYTVDSEKIVQQMLAGIGVPAKGRPISPVMQFSKSDLKIEPDIQRARDLLAAAGWKDTDGDGILENGGQPLQVSMLLAPWSPRQKIEAEAIQGQLKEVGIDLKLTVMETGALTAAEKAGEFDILLRSGYYTWGSYPHHFKIHTTNHMYGHWDNSEYDRLVAQAEAALGENEKKELYKKLQQIIIDQLPALYTIHEEKVVATRDWVKNYQITSEDPWLNLAGVKVEK